MEPFIGEIIAFGFNFAPRGWAQCNGQLLPISQNTALFSLLGTTYGGDGRTTFALPDLRGRTAMHTGQGPGLSSRQLGLRFGTETNTLNVAQMPNHNHTLSVSNANGNAAVPVAGNSISKAVENQGRSTNEIDSFNAATPNVALNTGSIGSAGGQQPFNNIQPSLVVNWCIALQGIFPSRN
ncbi:tail Collar domain-containing protein [Patiriisocius marinistellae]|uniref:Tail Collar domain-containing protein n=1 Tax=Patiriisocius marinistellae TaxID=2494560 RepID=A0A5J4FZ86_9FLAO|nr:tail fiber protein [Patiriisocius marinistellae]GEQ85496.1 tail Collar domain-containing protein [Patiriisocius marinistellae]